MKMLIRALWILISVSSLYYTAHTQLNPKIKDDILLKANIAQQCLESSPQEARILLNEVVSELHRYYIQNTADVALADLLSQAEFHLGCLAEKAHDINACIMHFDQALSYTSGFFPAAFARLSIAYMECSGKTEIIVPQGLLLNYIDYCNKYLANTILLPYEVSYIAQLSRTRIQFLLVELWSELPATLAENRVLMQKALDYLPQLKLYVENYCTTLDPLVVEKYTTLSYYYSILFWFLLGNYYADQAMLFHVLNNCDKALQYFTLIEQAYPQFLQSYDKFMGIYKKRETEIFSKLEKACQSYAHSQDILEKSTGVKHALLLKKAALLQATGKKKQVKQAITLLEHALSNDTVYSPSIQQQLRQQLAEAKLQSIRFRVQNGNKFYTLYRPDIEYAVAYGTPAVQADALLMKAVHALAQVTTCADFDAIALLIEQARTKTQELPQCFVSVSTKYHKSRAAFLFKNQQLLTDTVVQEKFNESIQFCCNSCDSAVRHEGLYYKIMVLIKQQTLLAVHQALEFLHELKLERYNTKKITYLVALLHACIERIYQYDQSSSDVQELLEILWQEYRSLDSGILLAKIRAQHKESLECVMRLINLIKELLPVAGKHTQTLRDIAETCYYTKACHESTSFDKAVLEQALSYFKTRQLLKDPAAQRVCTTLAQQTETTEEFFTLVDQLQSITLYIKDTLINLLRNFCTQVNPGKYCYRQEIIKKEHSIKKYMRFLTDQEHHEILAALYITYMPLIIEQYTRMLKQPNQSKKESKKCVQLLAYIQQLCSFLRKQHTVSQRLITRYQTQLQHLLVNKRIQKDISNTSEHTLERTVTCLENLIISDAQSSQNTSQNQNEDKAQSIDQTHDNADYYFYEGVYYVRHEHALRCKVIAEQCAEQALSDSYKSMYAQLLYNQAQKYLFGEQQAISYGLELLKNSAALDNLAAALELAHLYRRTHTLWPSLHSILVDSASYGLPSYTYLARLTHQPLTQSTAYKDWRSACASQAYRTAQAIARTLVWSVYNSAIDLDVYQALEKNEEICDAYLCGAAYAYLEHCAHICRITADQHTRAYAPLVAQLLEETLLCPEQDVGRYPKRKKRKKAYTRDSVAQEITAWFERTTLY